MGKKNWGKNSSAVRFAISGFKAPFADLQLSDFLLLLKHNQLTTTKKNLTLYDPKDAQDSAVPVLSSALLPRNKLDLFHVHGVYIFALTVRLL